MVVQHILAVRSAKRDVRVPPESSSDDGENTENANNIDKEEAIEIKTEFDTPKDKECESNDIKTEEMSIEKHAMESENVKQGDITVEAVENELVDSTTKNDEHNENKTEAKTEIVDVEEYFVKYRNFSYLHCEWKTEEELRRGDRRIFSKIKRFQQKMANNVNIFEYVSGLIFFKRPTKN